MVKKNYTILIMSQKAALVKKFILSPLTLKIGISLLGIAIIISGYLVHNYISLRKKIAELQALRAEANLQREEISTFMQKISFLEAQLARLKEMEKQVEQELKEVKELKIKNAPKIPRQVVRKKNQHSEQKEKRENNIVQDWPEMSHRFKEKKVSFLEREREDLVRRLHQDLLVLEKEFSRREDSLKEIQEFLQNQKSILVAIPSLWPVMGRISSFFGETRLSPASGGERPHKGIDISAPIGTPVVAPAEGRVISAGWESELGRFIYLDHGHGFSTIYGHLKDILVKPGEIVKKGRIIGTVGMSGNSTGPHLHYEVHVQGRPVNPRAYLNQTG